MKTQARHAILLTWILSICSLVSPTVTYATANPPMYLAIDVSKSLQSTDWQSWRKMTNQIAADTARLPDGIEARIVKFGSSVATPPVFAGSVTPDAKKSILRELQSLRPSDQWTYFEPVFSDVRTWIPTLPNSVPIVVLYSDGKTSLPSSELKDIPILGAANSINQIDFPAPVLLWRPAAESYVLLAGTGGAEEAKEFDSMESAILYVTKKLGMATGKASTSAAARPPDPISLVTLLSDVAVPVWLLMSFVAAAGLTLLIWVHRDLSLRQKSSLRSLLPGALTRPIYAASQADTGAPEPSHRPELEMDPRRTDHLVIIPPDENEDQATYLALPATADPGLTLTPAAGNSFEDSSSRWIHGLPHAVRFVRVDDPFVTLENLGTWPITIVSPLGSTKECPPGETRSCYAGDEIELVEGWHIKPMEPDPNQRRSFLFVLDDEKEAI